MASEQFIVILIGRDCELDESKGIVFRRTEVSTSSGINAILKVPLHLLNFLISLCNSAIVLFCEKLKCFILPLWVIENGSVLIITVLLSVGEVVVIGTAKFDAVAPLIVPGIDSDGSSFVTISYTGDTPVKNIKLKKIKY